MQGTGAAERGRVKKWSIGSEQRIWGWGTGKRSGRPTPFWGIALWFQSRKFGL